MLSLNARVSITASIVLTSFFGLAGTALDNIYRSNSVSNLKQQLLNNIVILIAATELDEQGNVYIPEALSIARNYIITPQYYARVASNSGDWEWRSPRAKELKLEFSDVLPRNQHRFEERINIDHSYFAMYSMGVAWGDRDDQRVYTFSVTQNLANLDAQIYNYRLNLWAWLGGVALLLLVVQWRVLKWGLFPLTKVAGEIRAIKNGKKQELQNEYPSELKTLTDNINNLLSHQNQHLQRYRNSLADLAHSLKTPVAVLQNAVAQSKQDSINDMLNEQLARIVQITDYQLQRAAMAGSLPLAAPVNISDIVSKLFKGLQKVYADKNVKLSLEVNKDIIFYGDEGDIYEILGNVADNAFKFCAHNVKCAVKTSGRHQDLLIKIEDDGNGVSKQIADKILERGKKDEVLSEGQGIGLAVVSDIIKLYSGKLTIGESSLGGAAFTINFPKNQ